MIRINTDRVPNEIMLKLSYIFFYSFLWFVFGLFFFAFLMTYKFMPALSDSAYLMGNIFFGLCLGAVTALTTIPLEKKIIKRNIFIAGLIQVLKKHKSIKFSQIVEDYAYFVFQSRKVTGIDKDWAIYIEALIALGVIELKNHSSLKVKCKDFDFKHFKSNLFDAELVLKDKKVDVDILIKKLDNYIL